MLPPMSSIRDHINCVLFCLLCIGSLLIKEFGIRLLLSAAMLFLVLPLHACLTCYSCTSLRGPCAPLQILELSESLTDAKRSGDGAFSDIGPVTWNSLPLAVRHAQTLPSFKSQLKTLFFRSIQVESPVLNLFICSPELTFVFVVMSCVPSFYV